MSPSARRAYTGDLGQLCGAKPVPVLLIGAAFLPCASVHLKRVLLLYLIVCIERGLKEQNRDVH